MTTEFIQIKEKERVSVEENKYVVVEQPKNGMGLAGFILSIIALFTGAIPLMGWLVWLVGAILSVIGLFKKPRGFAIAGTIISFIGLIILIVVIGALAAFAGANS